MSRLDIAFMTSSSYDFKHLDPSNLPAVPTSVDVWILRGQDILITKDYSSEDQIINMKFTGFKQTIARIFSQTVVPTVQNYNQGLVIIDKKFQFVNMNSHTTFEVNSTADLQQIFTTLNQIIDQEVNFLEQLTSFENMLQTANVFTTNAPKLNEKTPKINKRHISQNLEANYTQIWRQKFRKRSIGDIFSPYSVDSIGDTANKNYKLMNRNFQNVHTTEMKLAHQQKLLSQKFNEMTTAEKQVSRKELFLELRSFKTQSLQNFQFNLDQILKNNKLDSTYNIVFELLRSHQFCRSNTCYTLPIFNILNEKTIQITVQKAVQSLAKAIFISCTILNNRRTSVYSHQIALIQGTTLHFQEDDLPSKQISDLIHPNIDKVTRPISKVDLLDNIFYPIYANQKISLQCLDPQFVTIDGERRYCDAQSLNFIDFPQNISAKNISILAAHVPHHFSSKLDFMNSDFRSISLFKNTNQTKLTVTENIVSYFEQATPIHWSLMFVALCSIILLLVLSCCICYLKAPKYLVNCLCCFKNNCFLKRKVITRSQEQVNLKIFYNNKNIDQNYQSNDLNAAQQQFNPTCPPMNPSIIRSRASLNLNAEDQLLTTPNDNKTPFNNILCVSNISDCFCARNYPHKLFECKAKRQNK